MARPFLPGGQSLASEAVSDCCHNGTGLASELGEGLSRHGSEQTLFRDIVDSLGAVASEPIEVSVDDYLACIKQGVSLAALRSANRFSSFNQNCVPRLRCLRS